jgi:rhomboid family GlyGly-CTERM serine protease
MVTAKYSKTLLATENKRFWSARIYAIVGFSMAVMGLLQISPADWQMALRYDREAVAAGQLWRLLSGNFVHLGWAHLGLNLLGLALGTWLFAPDRSATQWLLATLVAALSVNLGLFWFTPGVHWCVGLSGVLHGLMVVGFGGWALQGERYAWGFLALIAAKMTWEQLGGDMPWTEDLAGGAVVVSAHLWGAVGGLLYLGGVAFWRHFRPRV